MRRVLLLGGTGWLGREIAAGAVATGAEVVCLARGKSGSVPPGATLISADRTDPDAYAALTGEWDEVVEIAYEPSLVEPALAALAPRAAHWTLVSTISVYELNDEPSADESAALVEPQDPDSYADAKVLAERLSQEHVGDRLLVARAGLIVGPGDPSDRFGYWPARFSRPGPILVPTIDGRYVQFIDVADLAGWIVRAGAEHVVGAINAVGDPLPMAEFLVAVREVTGATGEHVAAGDEELLAHDVHYWAGPRSLPLWVPTEDSGFAQRSNAAFRAAGGELRPVRDTIARALADEIERGVDRPRRSGLTSEEEADVVAEVLRLRAG